MNLRTLGLVTLSLLGCADEKPFVSLSGLCGELATAICEGRARCCNVDPAVCQEPETMACTYALMPFERETGLRYEARSAATRLSELRDAVNACQGPLPLASFFQGGAALGTPCERDAQCASGLCGAEPRVCVDPASVALCPVPLP